MLIIFQEIAKHFDSEEDGYDVVIDAIDTMTGVAWYINDMKRKHEHAVRLQVCSAGWLSTELCVVVTSLLNQVLPIATWFLFH